VPIELAQSAPEVIGPPNCAAQHEYRHTQKLQREKKRKLETGKRVFTKSFVCSFPFDSIVSMLAEGPVHYRPSLSLSIDARARRPRVPIMYPHETFVESCVELRTATSLYTEI
jgi:hypothetical protein